MRVLLSAGGTAGHVLPALAVLNCLKSTPAPTLSGAISSSPPGSAADLRAREIQALFLGERDGIEQDLVTREGVDFDTIPAGAMHGVGVIRMARSTMRILAGLGRAFVILRRFKPDVVFLTGGFVGVPVSVAAWLRHVPAVVYLPDIEPGIALKVMARLATKVATTTAASAPYVSAAKMVVTGYPVRERFHLTNRQSARAHFGIATEDKALLVVGGSTGARSINRAVLANLHTLLDIQGLRILHVTGKRDWDEIKAAKDDLQPDLQERYQIYSYLHDDMADAMAAADLAVCRSGASSLGELPFIGLPAILVPYPYAWRYQKVNAQYLVDQGAAVLVEDGQLAERLPGTVRQLLGNPTHLEMMRQALFHMGGRNGAQGIAQLLLQTGTRIHSLAA